MENKRKAKALHDAGAALSVKLDARSTRGKRMGILVGEDAEADDEFWGQNAWNEADDSDFSSEEEKPDKFDSDFNDSEDEQEEDDTEEKALRKDERTEKRKRSAGAGSGVYREPKRFALGVGAKKAQRDPQAAVTQTPSLVQTANYPTGGKVNIVGGDKGAERHSPRIVEMFAPVQRSMRASTKNKTEDSIKVRQGEAKARAAQLKRLKSQPKLKGQFTQEQLLLEAIQTEQENVRWLLKQQRMEDEAKEDEMRPKSHKPLASRVLSRRGSPKTILFPGVDLVPTVLQHPATLPRPATPAVCKITGGPARYRDPLTGHPFADADAFRELRKRFGPAARKRQRAQREKEGLGAALGGGTGVAG
ncbi:unnamed protein product, partial [Choristocarpus tenellus]